MYKQFRSTVAVLSFMTGAVLAAGAPELGYMCVPTAGPGDAVGVPNVGAWCATPEHFVMDRENRMVARLKAAQPSLATAPTVSGQAPG